MHPQPQKDEILSSWLVRLCFKNGFPLHSFYSGLLEYKYPIWTRDIDRHPPTELLSLLEVHTHRPVNVMVSMTLSRYEGTLYSDLPIHGDATWLMPLGIFHRNHKRAGMQFCPHCLNSDLEPYYRISWRLALHVICPHHHCVMMDVCPRCKSPVMFHRHGVGRDKFPYAEHLRFCHECRLDFSAIVGSTPEWQDEESIQMLIRLIGEVGTGNSGNLAPSLKLPLELSFYNGLRTIIGLLNGRFGGRLQDSFSDVLGIKPFVPPQVDFEYLDVQRRLRVMLCACWLLIDWPTRFVDSCRAARLTRSRLTEAPDDLPFWLASVANEYLDCRIYVPSDAEVDAAISMAHSKGLEASSTWLAHLFGVGIGSSRGILRRWRDRQKHPPSL